MKKKLGIIDHKIVHEENVMIQKLDRCTLITTSAWRNNCNAAVGGVGILVSNQVENLIAEIKPHTDRILQVNITGNPMMSLLINYAPVNGKSDAEEHYERLSDITNNIPKHNIIISLGDFNAHLGHEKAKHTYHASTNKNGNLLHDYALECGLYITNVMFKKRNGKLWTYLSDMSGSKSQVDYILVNRKWKNSVKDVEAYSSFSSLGSDHRILTAKIKLSLRMKKSAPRKIPYDWSALNEPDLQQLYTVTVRNHYQALSNPQDDATKDYNNFILANKEAAKELIPLKKKRRQENTAKNKQIDSARQKVKKAFSTYQRTPNAENQAQLQTEKTNLTETYGMIEEEELERMIAEIEDSDSKHKHANCWKLINEVTGRKTTKKGIIRGNSKEERIKQWHKHFSTLLGEKPQSTGESEIDITTVLKDLEIYDGPFTKEELEKVKKSLRDGQSGPDDIPPAVVKQCDFDDIILSYANKLLIDKEKPSQWSEIDITPIPKSGDLSDTGNYRGISLSAVIAKVVNKMILQRIQPKIDPLLRRNQNGFRPDRSTVAQILALRRLIEGIRRNNRKAVIVYVDFKKAFDSVDRQKMMQILKAYDVPPNLLSAIELMYQDTRAKVVTPDGDTEMFEILAGILQGDTLAPFLFVIVLDYALRNAINGMEEELGFHLERKRSNRVAPLTITDLDFADDIALICQEIDKAESLLHRIENEANKLGLYLNSKKTEAQLFNFENPPTIKAKDGSTIKVTKNFKYLGGWSESSQKDFEVRKALAWSACHKLKKIWSSGMRRKLKTRLFVATVESVFLYGAETWTLTKSMKRSIDGCYTRMLRMALNISWKQKLTNTQLYQELPPVSQKIQARRMKLAGHCVRHPEEVASDLVLWEPTEGKTNRGRRTISYIDNLKEDTGVSTTAEIRTLMMDRDLWRERVKAVGRPGGRPK